jgi:hypothetical protein
MYMKKLLVSLLVLIALFIVAYAVKTNMAVAPDKVPTPVEQAKMTETYTSQKLGIEFEYPKEWGPIEEVVEKGCMFGNEGKITATDPCEHVSLRATGLPDRTFFLSAYSKLFRLYPNPRGGYWGDLAGTLTDQNFAGNYCRDKATSTCTTLTSKGGLVIAYDKNKNVCTEDDCSTSEVYFVKLPQAFFGAVLSTSELQSVPDASEKLNKLVDSIGFTK